MPVVIAALTAVSTYARPGPAVPGWTLGTPNTWNAGVGNANNSNWLRFLLPSGLSVGGSIISVTVSILRSGSSSNPASHTVDSAVYGVTGLAQFGLNQADLITFYPVVAATASYALQASALTANSFNSGFGVDLSCTQPGPVPTTAQVYSAFITIVTRPPGGALRHRNLRR